MDIARITALGFTVCAGQVDRDGVNYGRLSDGVALLTPDGEELVAQLEHGVAEGPAPVGPARAPRQRTRAAKPVPPADDEVGSLPQD